MTLQIRSARIEERTEACRFLFAHQVLVDDAVRRFEELFATGALDPAGLIIARSDDGIQGAIFTYRMGGAQAAMWLPVSNSEATRIALVHAALEWIRNQPNKIVQVLANPRDRSRANLLEQTGFRWITQLTTLSRNCLPLDRQFKSVRLTFRSVTSDDPLFSRLLMTTYESTLDVPELNGIRTEEETLEGYRASAGDALPENWVIEDQGQLIGIVMLTSHQDAPTMELTYMGLIASARGQGLGREVLGFALAQASRLARHSVHLNVDVRNEPALRIYRQHQFQTTDLQDVYLSLSK